MKSYYIFFILFLSFCNSSYSLDSLKIKQVFYNYDYFASDTTIKGDDTLKKYDGGVSLLNCDSLNCIAIYTGGLGVKIFRTTDSGYHWNLILDDGPFSKLGIWYVSAYPTPDFIIIGFEGDYLQRTTNGGITWDTINTHLNCTFDKISFLKNGTGIATGWDRITNASNLLFKTTNYGSTWTRLPSFPNIQVVTHPTIFSDSSYGCYAYNSDPTWEYYYSRTNDAGKTWNFYQYFPEKPANNFNFIDSLQGWAFSYRPYKTGNMYNIIIHTNDGGKTWEKQLDSVIYPPFNLVSSCFIDSLHGLVMGQFGKILTTSDGGKIWVHDTSISNIIYSMAEWVRYLTKKRFIVLNDYGKIFMYNEDGFPDTDVKDDNTGTTSNPINIYPNPATDFINISGETPTRTELYSIEGMKILETEYSNKIDISSLPAGIYFLKIYSGSCVRNERVVIIR